MASDSTSKKETEKGSARKKINETTKLLTTHLDNSDDEIFDLDVSDAEQSDEEVTADVLSKLHYAATRRTDLDRSAIREARHVEGTHLKESLHNVAPAPVSQKSMLNKMLETLRKDDAPKTAELSKRVRRLHAHGKDALPVPLPTPVQNRIERSEAYKQTTDTLSRKWARTVQKNRKAQQLVFPFNAPGKEERRTGDMDNMRRKGYEEEIDNLLLEAGVHTDQAVLKGEEEAGDLDYAPVSKEEVIERRRELAKVRSLMFHYEQKMKRIKKIKSKKFRRMMNKDKAKADRAMGEESDEEDMIRAERRRVEERMTLRHKNTSKWVRRQLQRKEGRRNANTKAAIENQLQLHDELKRRQGTELENTAGSDSDDAVDTDEEDERLEEEQDGLQRELEKPTSKPKGIMGMRFMQEAEERKRKEALELLKSIDQAESNFNLEEDDHVPKHLEISAENGGESDDSEAEDGMNIRAKQSASSPRKSKRFSQRQYEGNDEGPLSMRDRSYTGGFTAKVGRLTADDNPWLQKDKAVSSAIKEKTMHEITVTPPPAAESQKSKDKEAQKAPTSVTGKKRRRTSMKSNDDVPDPSNNAGFQVNDRPKMNETAVMGSDNYREEELARMQGIAEAFAGAGGADLADFEAAKESEIERTMPTAKSLQAEVLPGWGAWDGAGMKVKKQKKESPFAKAARERLEAARSVAKNRRTDRHLRHVILDQRRIKQTTELTLSNVPFPFTSREQWEREVGNPVNKEHVSATGYKKTIKKRVIAKPGVVINPIKFTGVDEPVVQHRGKRAVIDLRKSQARQRSKARRGLMS